LPSSHLYGKNVICSFHDASENIFIFSLFSSPGLGMWVSGGQINEFYEVTEIAVPVVYNTTLQQLCS